MEWTPQQADALKKIKRWARDKSAPQIMRVFGWAGTGKSTIARETEDFAGGDVSYMTLTGKAALVLRKKGCRGASTIHSAIYKPVEDPLTGHTEFVLNPDSDIAKAALVVVDEVGMANDEVGQDLLSYGVKILALGDPFQLPPPRGEGFFTRVAPDVMLTDIRRQAADNPIIRMSMDIREGRGLSLGRYGESQVVRRKDVDKEWIREQVLSTDQLLCGMNKTRQTFNRRVRELRGITGKPQDWHPAVGDRLVCLKNNRMKGLLNGGLWEAQKVDVLGKKITMRVSSLDEPQTVPVDVDVNEAFFLGAEGELDWRARKLSDEFCHGYALTVHKSQGSQWDNVLLFDESHVFRDTAANHVYTGVTRAAEKVTVVM